MSAAANIMQLYDDYQGVLDPAANAQSSWFDTYDEEFETPDSQDDPRLKAAVEALETRFVDKSPEQHVEEALLQYEKTYAAMQSQRWKGQERWMGRENVESRLTRIMFCRDFIARLNATGCHFLFLNDFSLRSQVGMNFLRPTEHGQEAKYIGAMQCPYCPEYSVMRFNEYNVPVNQKYIGWRTALLKCIFAGAVTEEQALEAFGPALGRASVFYREELFKFRNRINR